MVLLNRMSIVFLMISKFEIQVGFKSSGILLIYIYIYINDLFLSSDNFEIAIYGDDCTPYGFSGSLEYVIN